MDCIEGEIDKIEISPGKRLKGNASGEERDNVREQEESWEHKA